MNGEIRWFVVRLRVCPRPLADSWKHYDLILPAQDEFEAIAKAKSLTPDPNVAWTHPMCPFRGFESKEEAERLFHSEPW
jgi:hypothetical protein